MDIIKGTGLKVLAFIFAAMGAVKDFLLAKDYLAIKLFKTGVTIGPDTTLASLSECDYQGYSPMEVTDLNGPALDAAGNAYLTTPESFFQKATGGINNQVYAAALVSSIDGADTATGTAAETGGVIDTVAITDAGGPYQSPPKVTVGGATGSGAIVTATIDGDGLVDSLTIVDGGSDYTTPTLTFEPPVELVAGFNFDAAVPMILPTDALPVVMQVNLPSGV